MGGTSTDVSTMIERQESFTTAFEIEWGVPIQIPMIDIRTIGAGGGSIAWIDKGGMLRSARRALAPNPGRPATAAAASRRPSPTPMCCSAESIRTISSAGA